MDNFTGNPQIKILYSVPFGSQLGSFPLKLTTYFKCPECTSKHIIRQGRCITCIECGYSTCQ
jgi:hypothetical protein